MARLQRILRDVLIAVGTPIDSSGKHLPLSDVLVVLDHHHKRHDEVMQLVFPHLPDEVKGDFASLEAYRSAEQRKRETESTINRLRSLLSPIVKAIFSGAAQSIDFREIMQRRGIILVNLRETDYFSADQRNAIGGMLIHEILSAVKTLPRENRVPYYLFVDEAQLFMGQDIMEGMNELRKHKLSICIAGQYLEQFRTEEVDMTHSILENCGTVITFRQKHHENLDLWKQYFGYATLDFEELYQVMDRPDGHDVVIFEDHSYGDTETRSEAENWSNSTSRTEGEQASRQLSRSKQWSESQSESHGTQHTTQSSTGKSWSKGNNFSHTTGESATTTDGSSRSTSDATQFSLTAGETHSVGDSHSTGQTETSGETVGQSRGNSVTLGPNGPSSSANSSQSQSQHVSRGQSKTHGTSENHGTSQSQSLGLSRTDGSSVNKSRAIGYSRNDGHAVSFNNGGSEGESESSGESRSNTIGRSEGGSTGEAIGHSRSRSKTDGQSVGGSVGKSVGKSHTVTYKHTLVPRTREDILPTGRLRHSVDDQLHRMAQVIRTMPNQHALVSMNENVFFVRIADVDDAIPKHQFSTRIEGTKQKIHAIHPYYATPDLTRAGEDERLLAFIQDATSAGSDESIDRDESVFS